MQVITASESLPDADKKNDSAVNLPEMLHIWL